MEDQNEVCGAYRCRRGCPNCVEAHVGDMACAFLCMATLCSMMAKCNTVWSRSCTPLGEVVQVFSVWLRLPGSAKRECVLWGLVVGTFFSPTSSGL